MESVDFDDLVFLLKKMGIGGNSDGDIKNAIELFYELQDEIKELNTHHPKDADSVKQRENVISKHITILGEVFGKQVKELLAYF